MTLLVLALFGVFFLGYLIGVDGERLRPGGSRDQRRRAVQLASTVADLHRQLATARRVTHEVASDAARCLHRQYPSATGARLTVVPAPQHPDAAGIKPLTSTATR